jgi:hypothetical protein
MSPCFYCPCPADYRHGDVGWCEYHYWHVPAAVGAPPIPPCPDCAHRAAVAEYRATLA